MITRDKWVWMPHAGHFICGSRCQFRLNTKVGKYIVSTVGEMPDGYRDDAKFETIGCDRLYETMVFKAQKSEHKCCPWRIIVREEVDYLPYNKPEDAYKGHMKLCEKWARKQK